jgi:hypothetical protein
MVPSFFEIRLPVFDHSGTLLITPDESKPRKETEKWISR